MNKTSNRYLLLVFNHEVKEWSQGQFWNTNPGLIINRSFATCQPVAGKGYLKLNKTGIDQFQDPRKTWAFTRIISISYKLLVMEFKLTSKQYDNLMQVNKKSFE